MGGKGGEQKTKTEIDPALKAEAMKNLELANYVGRLPTMQNFGGSVAAFTPQQEAAMRAPNAAAASLGMPAVNTGMNIPGIPQPGNFGGIRAYSTQPTYSDAMSRVPTDIRDMFQALFFPSNGQTAAGAPAAMQGYGATGQIPSVAAGVAAPAPNAPGTAAPASKAAPAASTAGRVSSSGRGEDRFVAYDANGKVIGRFNNRRAAQRAAGLR